MPKSLHATTEVQAESRGPLTREQEPGAAALSRAVLALGFSGQRAVSALVTVVGVEAWDEVACLGELGRPAHSGQGQPLHTTTSRELGHFPNRRNCVTNVQVWQRGWSYIFQFQCVCLPLLP